MVRRPSVGSRGGPRASRRKPASRSSRRRDRSGREPDRSASAASIASGSVGSTSSNAVTITFGSLVARWWRPAGSHRGRSGGSRQGSARPGRCRPGAPARSPTVRRRARPLVARPGVVGTSRSGGGRRRSTRWSRAVPSGLARSRLARRPATAGARCRPAVARRMSGSVALIAASQDSSASRPSVVSKIGSSWASVAVIKRKAISHRGREHVLVRHHDTVGRITEFERADHAAASAHAAALLVHVQLRRCGLDQHPLALPRLQQVGGLLVPRALPPARCDRLPLRPDQADDVVRRAVAKPLVLVRLDHVVRRADDVVDVHSRLVERPAPERLEPDTVRSPTIRRGRRFGGRWTARHRRIVRSPRDVTSGVCLEATVQEPSSPSTARLVDAYDAVLLDLDGVVYIGPRAVPGSVEVINTLQAEGYPVRYLTNNAHRPAQVVAEHLRQLGIHADDHRRRDFGAGGRGHGGRQGAAPAPQSSSSVVTAWPRRWSLEVWSRYGRTTTTPRPWSKASPPTSAGACSTRAYEPSELACRGSPATSTRPSRRPPASARATDFWSAWFGRSPEPSRPSPASPSVHLSRPR